MEITIDWKETQIQASGKSQIKKTSDNQFMGRIWVLAIVSIGTIYSIFSKKLLTIATLKKHQLSPKSMFKLLAYDIMKDISIKWALHLLGTSYIDI